MSHSFPRLLGLLLLVAFSACSVLDRAPDVKTSGFLSDDSMLKPGAGDEAVLLYTKPGLDLSGYHAILLEPIEVWRAKDAADNGELPAADFARLAGVLQTMVSTGLAENWTMTDRPGKGVLRLRMALTDARDSTVAMDIVSMVIPIGMIVTTVNKLATGVNSFVGGAGGEAELTDSVSGEVLLAAVDRRVGGKSWTGATDAEGDIMATLKLWTDRIKLRIARH
ncbi:MAG: hypothetical protein DHS20C15_10510 [Planctomycetota bacterium]|nr:MAG: hypothetical protein DHS20C15_10510 [Planctomycetota bacterium]